MAHRDGDGWVECRCGGKHWGLHGAAGLLLVRDGQILLQHRAPWVHNGDTWGIPGGARDSHETIQEAALREAVEEIGIDPLLVTPVETMRVDHVDWSYETIIAHAAPELVAHEMNDESQQVEWVSFEDITSKHLHPSFAASWPDLRVLLAKLFM